MMPELKTLQQVKDELESIEPGVVAHDDADGITSAVLLVLAEEADPESVTFVEQFGQYITPKDTMVDMRPLEGFKGLCYDHHLGHPENPPYTLIWDDVPTSLIIFRRFIDKIPKEHWWKVVVGINGDGQPELIPPRIFKEFPELLMMSSSFGWSSSEGRYTTWSYPIYSQLSAYINAAARSRQPELAFEILLNAESPFEIVENEALSQMRETIAKRVNEVTKAAKIYSFGPFLLVYYQAEEKLGGRVAMKVSGSNATVLAINETTGEVSIRGDLATFLVEELNKLNIGEFGGHPGFAGGLIENRIDPKVLIKFIVRLLEGKINGESN